MQYHKGAVTITDQIAQLQARGLFIPDVGAATSQLNNISYYRLAGYWWPMQDDKVAHTFKPGSQLATVLKLYNFDRELRLLIFDVIERLEVSLRARLVYTLSLAHSPWWFEDPALFNNAAHHAETLVVIDGELRRSKEDFIQDHRRRYSADARRPPAWKTLEILSFGTLSRLYGNLRSSVAANDAVALHFLVPNHTYFRSWLQCISQVRNVCAHHGRLWNRAVTAPPKYIPRPPRHLAYAAPPQPNRLYSALCCLKYMLHSVEHQNQFTQRLEQLFVTFPNADPGAMGFPANWAQEPLWQS
jgi:abortive infection bacteriophage resistance protein